MAVCTIARQVACSERLRCAKRVFVFWRVPLSLPILRGTAKPAIIEFHFISFRFPLFRVHAYRNLKLQGMIWLIEVYSVEHRTTIPANSLSVLAFLRIPHKSTYQQHKWLMAFAQLCRHRIDQRILLAVVSIGFIQISVRLEQKGHDGLLCRLCG